MNEQLELAKLVKPFRFAPSPTNTRWWPCGNVPPRKTRKRATRRRRPPILANAHRRPPYFNPIARRWSFAPQHPPPREGHQLGAWVRWINPCPQSRGLPVGHRV